MQENWISWNMQRKIHLIVGVGLMQIILVKRTLYVTEKCKKSTIAFPGKTPLKLKKYPQN